MPASGYPQTTAAFTGFDLGRNYRLSNSIPIIDSPIFRPRAGKQPRAPGVSRGPLEDSSPSRTLEDPPLTTPSSRGQMDSRERVIGGFS